MNSPAVRFVASLVPLGDAAHDALDMMLDRLSVTELAALQYDWEGFWARPKQITPPAPWLSFGLLAGRGFGKTVCLSQFVNREAQAGRAMHIGLCAQNEEKTIDLLVLGEAGLIETSPPWFKARYEPAAKQVVWPNGARATIYTPEVPGAIRGGNHHLFWTTELIAWPRSTREEAMSNVDLSTRVGYGLHIWDTTPKRKDPLVRRLLERSKADPSQHIVINGETRENRINLTAAKVDSWYLEYGGTQRGREELAGEYLDDSDAALFKQAWINAARRSMPSELKRRILSVDPAISDRKGSDKTGIIDLGLGTDDQVCVFADMSGKHPWEAWGVLVIERYFDVKADCIVVERNRGGDAVVANLRACAKERKITVTVVAVDAITHHVPGTVYVKEINATRRKEIRAEPVASLYEKGRVSHVGSELTELEDMLTTWEPAAGAPSPDALDALVHGVWELAHLGSQPVDYAAGFKGLNAAAAALSGQAPHSSLAGLAAALPRSAWGSRL